jgi:hypothetical protein
VIPLGILSVIAATPARHEKLFWDLCFEADPAATVARKLRESQPDVVAIGLRNLQNMDYTNITANLDAYGEIIQAASCPSATTPSTESSRCRRSAAAPSTATIAPIR